MFLPFLFGDASALGPCLEWASQAATLAQQAPAPAQGGKDGGWGSLLTSLGPMLPILVIGVLFYFMMLMPERKKQADQKRMLAELKTNDRVVTIGGIIGVVSNLSEKVVTLKVDDKSNVKVQALRSSISRVLTDDDPEGAA